MNKYYFTFGKGQINEGKCVMIEGNTGSEAREDMVKRYGRNWAFQYTEEEYNRYKKEGTLTEVLIK